MILACREGRLFPSLTRPSTMQELAARLHANTGHLQVALRMLQSLEWISIEKDRRYSLTPASHDAEAVPGALLQLYQVSPKEIGEALVRGRDVAGMRELIEASTGGWGTRNSFAGDLLDGALAVLLLLALRDAGQLPDGRGTPILAGVGQPMRSAIGGFLSWLRLADERETGCYLSDGGHFIADRALIAASTASYGSMLSRAHELIFGDAAAVFTRDVRGFETHVNRTLNVQASGFQHVKYFDDLREQIREIFDGPVDGQPDYVVDMGCGDGTLLRGAYDVICASARGGFLQERPVTMVGADFNQESLDSAARTLQNVPHRLLRGDVADPLRLLADLQAAGIEDASRLLHIRSFLDHDRPYRAPANREAVSALEPVRFSSVDVDPSGRLIPPSETVQSMVEHLERWAAVAGPLGAAGAGGSLAAAGDRRRTHRPV